MNNKIIGIVIGVLILGVVIFSGMNNPEMSPSMLNVRDKIKSTGLTNPETIPLDQVTIDGNECAGGTSHGGNVLNCPGLCISATCEHGWGQNGGNWECGSDVSIGSGGC